MARNHIVVKQTDHTYCICIYVYGTNSTRNSKSFMVEYIRSTEQVLSIYKTRQLIRKSRLLHLIKISRNFANIFAIKPAIYIEVLTFGSGGFKLSIFIIFRESWDTLKALFTFSFFFSVCMGEHNTNGSVRDFGIYDKIRHIRSYALIWRKNGNGCVYYC